MTLDELFATLPAKIREFFPDNVKASIYQYNQSYQFVDLPYIREDLEESLNWCQIQFNDHWIWSTYCGDVRFWFKNPVHATMFILRWKA